MALSALGRRLRDELNDARLQRYTRGHLGLPCIGCAVPLASASAVGIRVEDVFLWQSYDAGVPVQPIEPISLDEASVGPSPLGLFLGYDLPPEPFRGLPYDLDWVREPVERLGLPLAVQVTGGPMGNILLPETITAG